MLGNVDDEAGDEGNAADVKGKPRNDSPNYWISISRSLLHFSADSSLKVLQVPKFLAGDVAHGASTGTRTGFPSYKHRPLSEMGAGLARTI